MNPLNSWGRLDIRPHNSVDLIAEGQAITCVKNASGSIPFGMGRSYGDACLNDGGSVWKTARLDHFIDFNRKTGILSCEAGILLRDIQRLVLPEGWMLPVTPGTQMVTVGGAIANDVHGKNHHGYGSFGHHVNSFRLLRSSGEIIDCTPDNNSDWFAATLGGIGLTGVILSAQIQLRPVPGPWLATETIAYTNIRDFFVLASESEASHEYTVSWIDCVASGGGRGLFMRGNHIDLGLEPAPKPRYRRVPCVPPVSLINKLTLRVFNSLYFNTSRLSSARSYQHYQPFFYPLDNVQDWNRIYGPHGFYQYQSVIPTDTGPEAINEMLNVIGRSGEGSFLAVLKTFGQRSSMGMLGFPQPGVTLALDFPNRGASTHALFEQLDQIVLAAKGRIYLAKDARMPRDVFEAGYPQLHKFLSFRDPKISSAMSRRLMGY
jgi:FAD/FMN-containing dehydrogenase